MRITVLETQRSNHRVNGVRVSECTAPRLAGLGPSLSHCTHCDGKKMGQLLSTPEPRGWEEIVSEELEGVSERGCATTKKKVVVPYPDDKVRNLGVTSNDWDDILEEFNNGMAGYWSSAAQTGPIALIFLVGIAGFFLVFFGVVGGGDEGERRLEDGTCLLYYECV